MKQIILSVMAFCFAGIVTAQTKAAVTAKIKTPTVQCEMCKKKIETYLKRYDGVMSVVVNYKKKETTVKYLTDRTDIEQIKTAIANAGYDADDVPANEESYEKLPQCCKKLDDAGGKKP